MPYYSKGKCIYKKSNNKKVGCTKGPIKKYMAALHANVEESLNESVQVGPNLQFVANQTMELNDDKISLSYKVKSQKAVILKVIYNIDKPSLESTIIKNKNVIWEDIETFINFSNFTLRDYNNITNKGIDKGISSANPEDIEGHFGLTQEDLDRRVAYDAPIRILKYFKKKLKPSKKKIGIEESLEFEKLFAKIIEG